MIYFIAPLDASAIKIGLAKDPEHRLTHLQIGNHQQLKIVATCRVSDDKAIESWLHRWFRPLSIRGEWFRPSEQILDAITAAQAGELEAFVTRRMAAVIIAEKTDNYTPLAALDKSFMPIAITKTLESYYGSKDQTSRVYAS
jgi:hypothetical protein